MWIMPPELVRLGTGFAAKTVCSQVFIAGREAAVVLREDVQAPGHPLLRGIRVSIDPVARSATAKMLGVWAPARAVHHEVLGCALIHRSDRRPLSAGGAEVSPSFPQRHAPPEAEAASHSGGVAPRLQALLDNHVLAGPGFRAGVVLYEGEVVAERYAPGFGAQTPLYGWSMTKTVNAVLVGTLIQQGLLSLDEANLIPSWSGDPRSGITLSDLMGMTSGLAWEEAYGTVSDVNRMLFLEDDMAALAMASPLKALPGTDFQYASGTSVLLSWIWQHRLADPELASGWPRTALFQPLGMHQAVLEADASGTFVGSSFMMATAREWARFGWFLAQGGELSGEPLLPEGFVSWMTERTVTSDGVYGQAQLWRRGPGDADQHSRSLPEDLFWLLGHDGQSMAVMPNLGLVVVRLGLTPEREGYRPQPLVNAMAESLVDQTRSPD